MPRYAKKRSAAEEAPAPAKPLKRSRDEEDSDQSSDEEPGKLSAKEYLDAEAEEASGDDESGSEGESDDVSEPDTEPDSSDPGTDSDEDGSRYRSLKEEEQAALDAQRIARLKARRNYF